MDKHLFTETRHIPINFRQQFTFIKLVFKRNFQKCILTTLVSLLLYIITYAQPTTLSEYTFITTGYKTQPESGGKMLSGYTLSNCGEWKVDQADATRTVEYKALFRETQASPCAIMIIYKKLEKGKVTDTEYFCIPNLEAVDLWEMTWKHLHEFAAKEHATEMYEAIVMASMKFSAYNIKALKQVTAETGPLPTAGVPSEPAVMYAEVMPLYPGGDGALQGDIQKNIKYPDYEEENEIQGTVYVQFVVEKDGSVANVEVLRGVSGGPGLSATAVNAIKKLKNFTPGKQQGVPVRVQMQYPVKFVLN